MLSLDQLNSKPLKGLKVGVIKETLGEGVEAGVASSIKAASLHLEQLGSTVAEVHCPFSPILFNIVYELIYHDHLKKEDPEASYTPPSLK
jgi:Asp-tRNA(Asn)/Glu-tRNA(Gln) amidotransferase A subunit family amidase